MMKLFRSTDDKLADIGFKRDESVNSKVGLVARYIRRSPYKNGYTHVVDLVHKANGNHILQSYDPDLSDVKNIGNVCIGLTCYELKLFAKKMAELGLEVK